MQYSTVLAIASQSAVSTLSIVLRQCRKDTLKVAQFSSSTYRFLTSSQAIATYGAIWRLMQILCMIAVALGMSARALVDQFIAAQTLTTEPETVNGSHSPDPWEEELPLEQSTEPAILALPAPAQPLALLLGAAQPALLPAARATAEPAWKSLRGEARKAALRKACTAAGVQWRWKSGKGQKFMTIAQMEAALLA